MFEASEESWAIGAIKDLGDIPFPLYRKLNDQGDQVFKLLSVQSSISLRNDYSVKAIGKSENMTARQFWSCYKFQECTAAEFNKLYGEILIQLAP